MSKFQPTYDIAELKAFLDERLGAIVSFEMVTECSRPENYRVVMADGTKFLVKCVPQKKAGTDTFHARFLPNLQALASSPEAVKCVGGPWDFQGHTVIVLSWCAGGRIMPDRLTAHQQENLIQAYARFSEAMQQSPVALPVRDLQAERTRALSELDRWGCRGLRSFIQSEVPSASLAYDPQRLKVIHGDLHHGNFHFEGERVAGFMDFEEFRLGYATDDWMRYVIVAAEHLHWFDRAGRRRLLDLFSRLLPCAPADEWRLAIMAFLTHKIYRRFTKKRNVLIKIWWAQKIRFRLGFYRALLKRLADYEQKGVKNGTDNTAY